MTEDELSGSRPKAELSADFRLKIRLDLRRVLAGAVIAATAATATAGVLLR